MHALINVGLDSPKGEIEPLVALAAMQQLGVSVMQHDVRMGKTGEMTVVAEVYAPPMAFRQLSDALDQDCIVVYDLQKCRGSLVGERAADWGKFNPDYFSVL